MSRFTWASQLMEEHPRPVRLLVALLLVVLLGGGVIYAAGGVKNVPQLWASDGPVVPALAPYLPAFIEEALLPGEAREETLFVSGTIEAEAVNVASEYGGRIVAMPVAVGERVAAGEVVVRLDTSLLDAKIEVAEAALDLAQAGLAQAKAGARPGQVAIAEAQLDSANVGVEVATEVLSSTQALVERPQDLLLAIAVSQAQLVAAEREVAEAAALKDAAELAKNRFETVSGGWSGDSARVLVHSGDFSSLPEEVQAELPASLDGTYEVRDFEIEVHAGTYDVYKEVKIDIPLEFRLTPYTWWQAWVGVNAASASVEGERRALGQLYAQYNNPVRLQANVDAAAAALEQAKAGVGLAEIGLRAVQAGATETEVAALAARVSQAEAALKALRAERDLMAIKAPTDAVVLEMMAHEGEIAAPGSPLLTLADLSQVNVITYVPEGLLGRIAVDQSLEVTVDGQRYVGEVVQVAEEAEFTPRNISTPEERATLVFAVTLRLDNGEGKLKPGMSANVRLPEEAS